MTRSAEQLEQAIHALEAQRAVLGDAVLEIALAPLQAELAALRAGTPAQQLRLVSVLFLDVVGSTAMSRELDPEDIQAVMDGALAAFTTVIDQHGGRVLQYAGDSLLAAFGADEVHEDDAERAVLAGLAWLRQAQLQAEHVLAQHGQAGFGVRVGISSGSVLIGGGVDGEHSIRGSTVNIAARMEQAAPPGTLRISHDTWRLVRGLFEVDEQPPLQVKGRDEAMLTYLVRGAVASPPSAARRGVAGVNVPMLGRDPELALMQRAYTQVSTGEAGLVLLTIVADAGLGKTRLLDEFERWVVVQPAGVRRLGARASERSRGRPYGLMREIFMARLGLRDSDSTEHARQTWLTALTPALGHAGSAAVLGYLLGLDFADEPEVHALRSDAKALRDRAFFHAVQLLSHAVAGAAPLLLALDDLHWADDGSLDFVDHLLRAHAGLPLLLVGLTRPTLFERRPTWGKLAHDARRIELAALDAPTSQSLANALLQHLPEVPAQLSQLVAGGAEGNPFFMEELVNMLIDRGAIAVLDGRWTLQAQALLTLQMPATLTGVLQARLDALPADRRRSLQLAAVAGPVFWDQALAALDVLAVAALGELVTRELLRRHDESRLAGADEYAFRHHSLHRVAYESVLKRIKRSAHAALARWLSAQPAADALQDEIAEHHERGGERRLARDAWHRAADGARSRFANAQALAHAERALALTDEHELPRRLALTLLRLRVLQTLADRLRSAETLAALEALAESSGDDGWRSEAAEWRAKFEFHGGNALAALEHARRAVALAPAADFERQSRAHCQASNALERLGRYDEAQPAFEAALRLAQVAGHAGLEASIVNHQGMLEQGRGDVLAAVAHFNQALAIHRREGHLANVGSTLANLAFTAMSVGDFELARSRFEEARGLSQRVGQLQNVGIIDINLGIVLLHLAQPEPALRRALHALELLRARGDRWAEAAALRVAGQAELALGHAEHARAYLVESRDLFDALTLGHLAMESIAAVAEEALARDDTAAAMVHGQEILSRRAAGASLEGADEPMRIPLAAWRALKAAGDARADAVLAEAQREVLARADRLLDAAQRRRFLTVVAQHREIMSALARP